VLVLRRGSADLEVRLDNVRRSCASSNEECSATIASMVDTAGKSSVAPHPLEAPLDRVNIRLTPKPAEWLLDADSHLQDFPDKAADNRIMRRAFVADLSWVYVSDEPKGMRILNAANARELGLTADALHALAIANLATQYPTLELQELTAGLWTLEPGDYLDSARLALLDQWRAEARRRGGKLIATVPARSRVFVANDVKLRAALEKITAKAFAEEDHPVSTVVLEWTDAGWQLAR